MLSINYLNMPKTYQLGQRFWVSLVRTIKIRAVWMFGTRKRCQKYKQFKCSNAPIVDRNAVETPLKHIESQQTASVFESHRTTLMGRYQNKMILWHENLMKISSSLLQGWYLACPLTRSITLVPTDPLSPLGRPSSPATTLYLSFSYVSITAFANFKYSHRKTATIRWNGVTFPLAACRSRPKCAVRKYHFCTFLDTFNLNDSPQKHIPGISRQRRHSPRPWRCHHTICIELNVVFSSFKGTHLGDVTRCCLFSVPPLCAAPHAVCARHAHGRLLLPRPPRSAHGPRILQTHTQW